MVKFTLSPLLSSRLKWVKFEPRFRAWNWENIASDYRRQHKVSCQTSDLAVALCTCNQYPCTALQTATSLVFTNAYTNCNVRVWQALPTLKDYNKSCHISECQGTNSS
jgi:hypothetical protein